MTTEPLAEMLDGFVNRWRSTRPSTAGRFAARQQRTEVAFVSPIDWLAEESRRHDPDGRGVSPGTIERIRGRRSRTTGLRAADALVAALGCPEVFHDGTLEIRPNPCASPSEQAACCGGAVSMTGALDPVFWAQLSSCVRH